MLLPYISSLSEVLQKYNENGIIFENIIDGGAGTGDTALMFSKYTPGTVYAFEPLPGNWPYILEKTKNCSNVRLVGTALGKTGGKGSFLVPWSAPDNYEWRGRTRKTGGWSHCGMLVKGQSSNRNVIEVQIARGDDAVPDANGQRAKIHFVKLDLQGGELDALEGMQEILADVHLMYIEYTGQPGLLKFLYEKHFLCFEQTYLFKCDPAHLPNGFTYLGQEQLSTGGIMTSARHDAAWDNDPKEELALLKKSHGFLCTDILCIPANKIGLFEKALGRNLHGAKSMNLQDRLSQINEQCRALTDQITSLTEIANEYKLNNGIAETIFESLQSVASQSSANLAAMKKSQNNSILFPAEIWGAIPDESKISMLKSCPNIDIGGYLEDNPDVRASGMDPLQHYIRHGIMEGRNLHLRTAARLSPRGEHTVSNCGEYSRKKI